MFKSPHGARVYSKCKGIVFVS